MLYKFRSKASADLIMLEPNGRQLLEIMGKDPRPPGILLPQEMARAMQALQQALDDETQALHEAGVQPHAVPAGAVSLRQRALPMLDMLRRCERAGAEIVWGV